MQTLDDFLNLDNVTGDAGTDLFFGGTPSSLFEPSPPVSSAMPSDTLDGANYHDLYRTWFRPDSKEPQPAIFNFADLLAASTDGLFTPPGSSGLPSPNIHFSIDPQLVATQFATPLSPTVVSPATTAAAAPPTEHSDDDNDDDDEADSDAEDDPSLNLSDKVKAAAARVKKVSLGGPSAGVIKRSGGTSCVVRDPDSNDPEDWRPSPEEYKKLSSKEKRQLRNKISARNFRVRRKEYITTLESHIADRDRLIDAIRDELGASKLENADLRQEIDALKKAMLQGRASYPVGLPPPSTSVPSAAITSTSVPTPKKRNTSTPLAKANVNKDLAHASPRGGRPFWGGASMLGAGGITPVHATLIPDITFPTSATVSSVLSGKGQFSSPPSSATTPSVAQENINPNLNFISPTLPQSPPATPPSQAFNAFSDINPFTIKSLDSYRLQLWTKMAAAGHLTPNPSQLQQTQPQNLFNTWQQQQQQSGLAASLRPAFFTSSSSSTSSKTSASPTLSALLAGKAATASTSSGSSYYPTAPPSRSATSPTSPSSLQSSAHAQAQATAYMAALASHSLMSRMGTAFWDAFSGPTSPTGSSRNWDAEKVKRVLEGKAVVRVVDIDEPVLPTLGSNADLGLGIEDKLKTMSISGCDRENRDKEYCSASAAAACSMFGGLRTFRDSSGSTKMAEAK